MDSMIVQSPLALVLYGLALLLNLIDRYNRVGKGLLTVLSAFFAVAATAYALIIGAGLWECAAVLLIFLLLNMGVGE